MKRWELREGEEHRLDAAGAFHAPVDLSVYTNYTEVIKEPMDLGTMTGKLDCQAYALFSEFKVGCMVRVRIDSVG